jgi:DNA-binding CsgD family transcriptional regulator/tetratricopeptide (TPR) repeat protein
MPAALDTCRVQVRSCRQLFGRDTEMLALDRALATALEGRGGVVLLTGPAGIGKSRLGAELLGAAQRRGVPAALGRASAAGASVPFLALRQALLGLVRDPGVPTDKGFAPWRAALSPVLPFVGQVPGAVPDVSVRAEAVVQLLRRVVPHGAVIVLEDLHWADPDTVELLGHLADSVAAVPVLWLLTGRESDAMVQVLDRFRGRQTVTSLPLAPLTPVAVAHMVAECRPDAAPDLVDHVHRSAEGVPLYVEQITAADGGVPSSFTDAVATALAGCDPLTRRVVHAAAVLGRADVRLLREVTGADGSAVPVALQRAVDAGLLVPGPDGPVFRHVLTREAVLETLGPERAALACAALAAVDRGPGGPGADQLAGELAEQAGDRRRAGQSYAAAGERAREQGALPTATEALTRAVRLLAGYPECDTVRLQLVESLGLAGRVDDALAEGAVLAATGVPGIGLVLAEVAARGARWAGATHYLEDAGPGDRREVLEAEIAFALGRDEQARAALARMTGADPDLRARALLLLGRVDRRSDLSAARTSFELALGTARAAQLPVRELDALHELGTIDLLDHSGTERLLQARRVAERLGALGTRAVLDLQLAAGHLGRFETASAERHANEAAQTADQLGLAAVAGKARCGLAEVCAQRLDPDGMERFLAAAQAADPLEPFTPAFGWGQCRGMLAFFRADLASARHCFERGVGLLAQVPNPEPVEFRALWPLLLALDGDPRAGAEVAAALESDLAVTFANRGLLGYAAAVLAGAGGDPTGADDLVLDADAHLAAFPVWRHLARVYAAPSALAHGWGQAYGWWSDAEPVLAALGLAELAAHCRRSRELGAISPREAQVLALVCEGLSNRDIAARLYLSVRTVEKHVESLLRKTGTRSRTQLALWAGRPAT